MSDNLQVDKANLLRKMLTSGQTFVLPEVWDVASARVLADAGFKVLGTSATAIAWANGYKPHEPIKLEDLLMTAARIARGSQTPVNADLEGGIGRSLERVTKSVEAALAIGCAGITIGDGSRNGAHVVMPEIEMAERIRAAREAAERAQVPLVITARTESFLLGPLGQSPFETSVQRAYTYFNAGADCVLIPGVQHLQIVEKLASNIGGPFAISISLSIAPDLSAYSNAGVSCITLGSSLMRSLLGNLRAKAEELFAFGHFTHLDKAIPQNELEALLR